MSHQKNQTSKTSTWAEKVKVSDSSTRCSLEQLPRQPAGSTLKIPRDMQLANEEIWSRCMVGFFVGYKMPFHAVNSIARRIWNPFGLEKVTTISNDFIMFRFSAESSIQEIMAKGPWLFGGKSIILHKWYPGFQFDRNKINTLPVWVRLMGLPFPLWNKQGLSLAASMVGKPLACDENTLNCNRLEYARVCVEVDATFPYVHQFKVESQLSNKPLTVEVIYEWKPSRCPKCKVFGHSCKEVKPPVTDDPSQVHITPSNVKIHTPAVDKIHPVLGQETASKLLPNIFSADPNLNPDHTTKPNETIQKSQEHDNTAVMHNLDLTLTSQNDIPIPTHTKNIHTTKKGNLKGKAVAMDGIAEEGTNSEVGINTHKETSIYHCIESKMDSKSTSMSDLAESSNSTGQPVQKMVGLGSWNIRGLNNARKQGAVRTWMHRHQLDIIGILETRVMPANMSSVQAKLDPHWKFISASTDTNCRIMVGWNAKVMDFHHVNSSSQWITGEILNHNTLTGVRVTFVYGLNNYTARRDLWKYLIEAGEEHRDIPWVILVDFNAILRPSDRDGGSTAWHPQNNEFQDCISQASLQQVPYSGMRLTWHNSQQGENTILKKLDWVFGNNCFSTKWRNAKATFLPRQDSDHSAMILNMAQRAKRGAATFKFLNFWTTQDNFMDTVKEVWQSQIRGNPLFQITTKLNILKFRLKAIHNRHTSQISSRVGRAKAQWAITQEKVDARPGDMERRQEERKWASTYANLCRDEEAYFKQKSRIQWLKLGDQNTRFFHKSLIHRQSRNTIRSLTDTMGNEITGDSALGNMAVQYYKTLLQSTVRERDDSVAGLFSQRLTTTEAEAATLPPQMKCWLDGELIFNRAVGSGKKNEPIGLFGCGSYNQGVIILWTQEPRACKRTLPPVGFACQPRPILNKIAPCQLGISC
ncbi:hypothetical protein OIU78_004652 [Salix suchowensis]|nr:hypothetical protein OIU78_004652 [Salix suchowensis]